MAIRRLPATFHRSLVLDVLHFASQVPTFPAEQTFDLSHVAALRQRTAVRISWTVCFMKAFALVALDQPLLRQAWIPFPWSHICENDTSVAVVAMHREYEGSDLLCWGRFQEPESTPLAELQASLDRYQREPVEQVFRRQLRLGRSPGWLRRMAWRWGLFVDVARRAKRFGTFSISSLAGVGTLNRFHPSLHTTSLTYGPLDEQGRCQVTLICDHRLIDGMAAARALTSLQTTLQGTIAQELASLGAIRRAA